MATNVQKIVYVTSTGASGAQGFTGAAAAQQTAVQAAITTATGATGYSPNTLNVGGTTVSQDSNGGIWSLLTSITYVVNQ